jgi:hypothetical protein
MRSTSPWLQSCLNLPVPVLFQVRPLVCQLRRCDGGILGLGVGKSRGLKRVRHEILSKTLFVPQDPAAIIIARLGRRRFGNSRELPEKRRVGSSNHAEGREVREKAGTHLPLSMRSFLWAADICMSAAMLVHHWAPCSPLNQLNSQQPESEQVGKIIQNNKHHQSSMPTTKKRLRRRTALARRGLGPWNLPVMGYNGQGRCRFSSDLEGARVALLILLGQEHTASILSP